MSRELDVRLIRQRLGAHEPRTLPGKDGEARAAVAAILAEDDEPTDPRVLLIRRAENPLDPWSGHMALPGGRKDPRDPTLLDTVMRETMEEVGLDLRRKAELIGRLDDLPAVARARPVGLIITPFVFRVPERAAVVPNQEVAEAVWAPLRPLYTGAARTSRSYEYEGRAFELPAYDVDGRIVWGLTYQMIESLLGVLRRG